MIRKILLAGAASALLSTGAQAACPNVDNGTLKTALQGAISDVSNATKKLGLGLNMWATVVSPEGVVCAVAYSSNDAIQGQWLASRAISAQKAFTAATLSLGPTSNSGSGTGLANGKLALSTANLFSAVNPGGSLYGLQHSNPLFAPGAYGDRISTGGNYAGPTTSTIANYGTANDPMIGQIIGGINVFGGGLGLYASGGAKVGGVGVSGDTSCTDHTIAWQVRYRLGLDKLSTINGVAGAAGSPRPDNIIFDITPNPNGGTGVSAGGFGHPNCSSLTNSAAQTLVNSVEQAVR